MIIDANVHLWNKVNGKVGNKQIKPLHHGINLLPAKRFIECPTGLLIAEIPQNFQMQ
jgi:hypothetical protein